LFLALSVINGHVTDLYGGYGERIGIKYILAFTKALSKALDPFYPEFKNTALL